MTKFLVQTRYVDGVGRRHVEADTVEEAFDKACAEMAHENSPEVRDRPLDDPESMLIEQALPLKPGQHPDTPPLWRVVGSWSFKEGQWEKNADLSSDNSVGINIVPG